jgi:hypothetical protein
MIRSLRIALLALPVMTAVACHKAKDSTVKAKTPYTLRQVWTLNATYRDREHGVSFRYPSVWKAGTQFSYWAPILSSLSGAPYKARPIAGFGYSEGAFPRPKVVGPYSDTNLESVDMVYAAVPAKSGAGCQTTASLIVKGFSDSGMHKHPPVVFGGRSYAVYDVGGAGMSQWIEGKLYATYAGGTCYLFETDLAAAHDGVLDHIPALTQAQYRSIHEHLLEIMKTVRIAR